MLCYKELYGDDIDGNRGVWQFEVEVEQSDLEDVVEALYEGFLEDNTTGTQTIMLYCASAGEDVEVEVEIDDYIENLIEKADADEDIKDDEDVQEMLRELKQEIKNTKCCKILMAHLGSMEAMLKQLKELNREYEVASQIDTTKCEQGLVDIQEQVEKMKGEHNAKR